MATPPGTNNAPSAAATPAWATHELSNPHASSEKASKVRNMFSAIASSYDLNNRVHSLGRDQAWRKYAVKVARVTEGESVLDVACGTGDLSQAFARTPASKVTGLDFTPAMLDHARIKQKSLPPELDRKLTYIDGDAQQLPFGDGSFDVVSIAFGIRNVTSPEKALAEFYRVLRPGGRVIILEFDRPSFAPVRWFNDFYCGWIMPRTATLISGDTSGAYRYLPASVGTFMSRRALCDTLRAVGFSRVADRALSLGICVCYSAVREH